MRYVLPLLIGIGIVLGVLALPDRPHHMQACYTRSMRDMKILVETGQTVWTSETDQVCFDTLEDCQRERREGMTPPYMTACEWK